MDYEKGSQLLANALGGFHGRFKKMFGQAALRLDSRSFIMTPVNVQLSVITESDFVVCDINTGDMGEIFRRLPSVNAIIFGCSQDTVKASERDSDLPVALEDLAHLTGSKLKVIPDMSPDNIVKAMSDTTICLIRGIGVISAASNARKAAAGVQIVEKACEAEVHGELLGGTIPLPEAEAEEFRKEFRTEYVNMNETKEVAYMGFDEEEFALRSQLIDYGRELTERDLAYGSWGNLSLRINDHEMLISPSSMDYSDITPEDIVRVSIDTLEYGNQRVPSTSSPLHAAIYKRNPDCSAIIHTHSNALSVFAACRAGFAIPDPAMRQLIGDILIAGSTDTLQPGNASAIAETMTKTHAAIIPHHGGIFTGPTLDVVLAIAEAVEMRARALLNFEARSEADAE